MTDPDARTIELVLDTSATTAWARGSLSVGELLAEIGRDHGAVLVPLGCLIEAAALVPEEQDALDLLVQHEATFVVTDDPADWRILAGLRIMLGNGEMASAAWTALDASVSVLTGNPSLYADLKGGNLTIAIDEEVG